MREKELPYEINASALVYYRKKNDLTQDKLEERSGISQERISQYENGRVKSLKEDTIGALANALGCTIEDLQTPANKKLEVARGVYIMQQAAKLLENTGHLDISNATEVLKLFENALQVTEENLVEERPQTDAEKDVMDKLQNGLI